MKRTILKIAAFAIVSCVAVLAFSCKRCSTCTFNDQVFGKDTSEFCGSGNSYKDQLKQHEDNGWKCVEN